MIIDFLHQGFKLINLKPVVIDVMISFIEI